MDKLAELEKAILEHYLTKGYQLGIGGWGFKVNISTFYKTKEIQIMFRENVYDNYITVFRAEEETTKEMFNEALKFFSNKI